MSKTELAKIIEDFFLQSGKWELEIDENPLPGIIGGRWLSLSDANYGFRPIDLAEKILNITSVT
jgi:hypothetical protein